MSEYETLAEAWLHGEAPINRRMQPVARTDRMIDVQTIYVDACNGYGWHLCHIVTLYEARSKCRECGRKFGRYPHCPAHPPMLSWARVKQGMGATFEEACAVARAALEATR